MPRHERPELGQQRAVVAPLQIEVDPAFHGEQAELFELLAQPPCLGPALGVGVDVGEDGAAPQAQRLPQLRAVATARALVHEPPETADIDLVVLDGKGVGARHGGDDVLAHELPQPADIAADQGVGPVAVLSRPQQLTQPPGGERSARVEQEQCQQITVLRHGRRAILRAVTYL